MPLLSINGSQVRVDDSFSQLAPADQQAMVNHIAAQIAAGAQSSTAAPAAPVATPVPGFVPGQPPTPGMLAGLAANWGKTNSGSMPPEAAGPAPDSGPAANAVAGLNDVIYRTIGAPVDITNTGMRMGAAALHAVGGPDIQLPVDTMGGHQSIADLFAKFGTTDPTKVVASTEASKLARAAGAGAGYAVAPEMALRAVPEAAPALEGIAAAVRPYVGMTDTPAAAAQNAVAGATSGAGAQAAEDAAPDNLKPLAAMVGGVAGAGAGSLLAAAPKMVATGGRLAADMVAPALPESIAGKVTLPNGTTVSKPIAQLAGARLAGAADASPAALVDAIESHPTPLPGVQPTTAQAAGNDYGLYNLERTLSTKNAAPFVARQADNNAARVAAIQSIQEPGAPEAVATALKSNLSSIEQAAQAQAQAQARAATTRAATSATSLAPVANPEDIGANMGQAYEAARAVAKTNERSLWQAVDPTNSMSLDIGDTLDTVAAIKKSLTPMAAPPTGEEASIYSAIRKATKTELAGNAPASEEDVNSVLPLQQVTDLQSRLKTAMRQEKATSGETPAYARMSRLNGALESDLNNAVVAKTADEQQAVKAGSLNENDTILSRLKDWQNAWYSGKSGVVGSQGLGGDAGTGPTALPGIRGTAGQAGIGPADAASSQGIPSGLDTADAAATIDRLKAARAATLNRVNTFDNRTLAPIRARPTAAGPYNLPRGAVPGRIFFPGPKSTEAIRSYRTAVGDQEALPLLSQYAANKLRSAALRTDGTLDPARTASFVRNHADALRALPGFNTRILDAVNTSKSADAAAKQATAAVGDASQGVVGKLATLTDPTDISRTIGTVFNRADSMKQMAQVKGAIGNSPEGLVGLKKAVANHLTERFIGGTEVGLTGQNGVKAANLQNFLTKHAGALKTAGFDGPQMTNLRRIADSLQEASRSVNAVKLPGGPNTARDVLATHALDAPGTMLTKIVVASALSGGGAELAAGHFGGPLLGPAIGTGAALATGLIGALRQQGLTRVDKLVEQAMLDPEVAKTLLKKVKLSNTRRASVTLGQRFNRSILAGMPASSPRLQ